jgi:parvulin-like peptidyl-prolyl isomerase
MGLGVVLAGVMLFSVFDDCSWSGQLNASPNATQLVETGGRLQVHNQIEIKSPGAEVVARVNGDPVTRAQFDRMVTNPRTLHQAQQELGIEKPDRKELEKVALRKLVQLHLLVQEAKRRNITVTQDELDQAINTLRRRFNSLEEFGDWVKEQGLNDPELFESVRTDMLADRAERALVKDLSVNDEEIQRYYNANKENLIVGEKVRLRLISVQSQADAEDILKSLHAGESFSRLAQKRSNGPRAAQGGDTGWINSRQLPLSLQQVAGLLKAGDIGGPLQTTEEEFLLVGLVGRQPLLANNLIEAKPEIERRLLTSKQQKTLQRWFKEKEQQAEIEIFLNMQSSSSK